MLLKVKKNNKVIGKVIFKNNLTLKAEPAYMNEGGEIGLIRGTSGKLKGKLVFMYKDNFYPSSSFAILISEEEAYDLCECRGKFHLIDSLKINPVF